MSSNRHLIRMVLFIAIVGVVTGLLAPKLVGAFLGNPLLNGMILGVLLLGILYIFRQVLLLKPELRWLEFVKNEAREGVVFAGALQDAPTPRLLGPMATMIGEKTGRLSLSTLSMRSLLDGIHARIQESHEISRYLIGLLIFLGLLGTFWGLLETVNSVGGTIASLGGGGDDPLAMFDELKSGLEKPLSGMGTAFSSSLFGLAGSLILGFLELQAGQAHNRFMNHLEEWLSSLTRLSSGPAGEGEQGVPAYVSALLEQTAETLEKLQNTIAREDEERVRVNHAITNLADRLSTLTEHMRTQQSVMLSVAETQNRLHPVLEKLANTPTGSQSPQQTILDEASRSHLRNMDLQIEKLSSNFEQGRNQSVQDIRNEIRLLTRTLAAIAEEK
ncbi:flagellar motor protein MotA [Kiloniella sp. b19]|uniref:flagellar motor protein MotA n=1 Tax=Kiloniella sp. GXU_MW_B19 TaxID=3141326 RepID=UPI0031DCB1D2